MGSFEQATREKLKLRMALDGPSGSGKSYTALRFAMALAEHYGARVAVIESENRSARKYVGEQPDGTPFQFFDCCLKSYAPTEYTSKIEEAGRAGFGVIVIDSLSHAWSGKDGALEMVDKAGKNKFTDGWKTVTPMHNRMIEAILASPAHVICTMRSKTEYILEEDEKGKKVPRKVAMAPIQRAGMEYEFDLYGSMDWSHIMTVTKSRCSAVDGLVAVKPGAGFILPVIEWLDTGVIETPIANSTRLVRVSDEVLAELSSAVARRGWKPDVLKVDLAKRYGVDNLADLRPEQAEEYLKKRLGGAAAARVPSQAPAAEPTASVQAPQAGEAEAEPEAVEEAEGPQKLYEVMPERKELRRLFAAARPEHADGITLTKKDDTLLMRCQCKAVFGVELTAGVVTFPMRVRGDGSCDQANPEPAVDLKEQLTEDIASPPPSGVPADDQPITKAKLATLKRTVTKFIAAGGKESAVLAGIKKRNPRAEGMEDLTWGQANDLEAALLRIIDPVPEVEKEDEGAATAAAGWKLGD